VAFPNRDRSVHSFEFSSLRNGLFNLHQYRDDLFVEIDRFSLLAVVAAQSQMHRVIAKVDRLISNEQYPCY
jgi:hypothetical protein